ncbi:hypothetical protein ES319_A03G231600v1 [Gossypium barbadense]|uniref:DUF7792 domain-containing protein n=2 Tax=Gossypium TaxID=3633 RepID=A0A5J5WII5_GOSBA|nr:hypothetical protein ES319_A03G231600v1 [Gossypium barbadense]TYH26514.1 hypothetical protein ES288_A03G258900v1 [Gossypium darwinii]
MALDSDARKIFYLILLGEDVCLAVNQSNSFKVECGELRKRAQCIVRYQKHQNLFYRLFTSLIATDFQKLFHVLDASITDMEWVWLACMSPKIEADHAGQQLIECHLLFWSGLASPVSKGGLDDRIKACDRLASLVRHKDEYKYIIVEEGGVDSLMKLLKENYSLVAHIAAANTLCLLANEDSEGTIMKEMISTFIKSLPKTSPISKQTQAADLVAGIAERSPEWKQHDLIRENIIWQLVILLSSEQSTLELKISWSVSNCQTLTETKGMLCLANLVAKEQGELWYNCIMIIKEITSIAESDDAAKAVVDELLRVIKELEDTKLRVPAIKSIGSLARIFRKGNHHRVISLLVSQLENGCGEVVMEALVALEKFSCDENYVCKEHSNKMIEFNAAQILVKLLSDVISGDEKTHPHVLAFICYLAQRDTNNNILIKAGALTALKKTASKVIRELEILVPNAISKLQSNKSFLNY